MKRSANSISLQPASETGRPLPLFVGATLERFRKRVPLLLNSAISSIYVEGESGTGKEMIADLIEACLPKSTPFVRINCGAITPSLMESELFGHKHGAFTGANEDKIGLFENANGGWLFLDEVSALTVPAQAALLRAIENKEIRRVGDSKVHKIQLRFLFASNDPLRELVVRSKFRKDLWQRIAEVEIRLTPLRERREEIPELIRHFCNVMPGGPYKLSAPAYEMLTRYSWSEGNVRELRNCLKAMTEFQMNQILTPLSVPERIWQHLEQQHPGKFGSDTPEEKQYLKIPWTEGQNQTFDSLCDHLFLELVRNIGRKRGPVSLKTLTLELEISRNTISSRLRGLLSKKLVSQKELNQWVKLQKV
jgi:DNA-binding NtrC family response regulator